MPSWPDAPGSPCAQQLEFFETGKLELYNLKDDLGERKDLSKARPEKVKELHDKLKAWRKAVGAPRPTPNKED